MILLWLKAFHLIAVICWFAGIFYLPRLFVYHASAEDEVSRRRFETMERKLYRVIMNPAMIATLVLGVTMLIANFSAYTTSFWIWIKILLVIGLIGYHHYCGALIRRFAEGGTQDNQPHNERFFRIFNEVPILMLIIVVLLAVLKPF